MCNHCACVDQKYDPIRLSGNPPLNLLRKCNFTIGTERSLPEAFLQININFGEANNKT